MYTLLLFLFVINAIFLAFVILMQRDKKGISGVSVFGQGGGGDSAFGGRETATFLHKLTVYFIVAFFVLAIAITLKSKSEFSPENTAKASSIVINKSTGKQAPAATKANPLDKIAPATKSSQTTPQTTETTKKADTK